MFSEITKFRAKRFLMITTITIVTLVGINMLFGTQWILFYDNSIKGTVIDAETGQPVGGAIVVGVWQLSQLVSEGDGGYAKVSLVKTDDQGKFTILPWVRFKPWKFYCLLHENAPQVAIYKPGYRFHWSSQAKITKPHMQLLTREELKINLEEHSINPAKLRKVYSDEERIQNYHDWETKIDFPGPQFPFNYFSKKEIRIIYHALAEDFSYLPKEKVKKYYLGN